MLWEVYSNQAPVRHQVRPPVVHTSSAGSLGLIPWSGNWDSTCHPSGQKEKKANKNRLQWEKLWVYAQVDKGTASTIKPRWGECWERYGTLKRAPTTPMLFSTTEPAVILSRDIAVSPFLGAPATSKRVNISSLAEQQSWRAARRGRLGHVGAPGAQVSQLGWPSGWRVQDPCRGLSLAALGCSDIGTSHSSSLGCVENEQFLGQGRQ